MAISIYEALNDHRYVYFGFYSHPTEKEPWQATPVMCYSDNLVQWHEVSYFSQLGGLRDGFVKKIGDNYYVIGTGGFYKTSNFISFEKLDYIKNTGNWKDVWAPEIVQDENEKYYISFCAGDSSTGTLNAYVTNFDPKTDTIDDANIKITFEDDSDVNSWKIDPDICLIDGNYYLALGGNYLFKSDQIWGPYKLTIPSFAPTPQKYGSLDSGIANWVEGPQLVVDGESVRLFADQTTGNGLVFRSATKDDLTVWSDTTNTHGPDQMRHGCILVNNKVSAEAEENKDNRFDFDHHVYIKSVASKHRVALTCFFRNTFNVQYEDNETNEITFTAYNDGSQSYTMIANESLIYFNNDLYIIKSVEEDHNGSGTYSVTALQYVNSEIGRVMQRNVRRGVLTYTVTQVLDFFLNDQVANPFGFSYLVFGDFDKQQIENLGNCSGKDMISKIVETWPGTIIYPVGKQLYVYSQDAFQHSFGRRIVYIQDTSDIKLTEDSTEIINQVRCIGATKDEDQGKDQNGDGGDNGDNPNPANVTTAGNAGNLDGPEGFAKSPINATWGVDKNRMIQDFAARSQKARARGVDCNRLYDVIQQHGVSPEWFMAYELCEQNSYMGWLNHWAYPHGDPYNDAAVVCDWIKQRANTDHLTPAWSAYEGSMVPNAGLEQRWNQEFPKGTIGRLYLQGTAAAVWELAGQVINPYIGKPLSQCVNIIRGWGGHTMQNGEVQQTNNGGGSSWGWPFPNIPANGEPVADMAAQRFGHTGWYGRGGQDFHDGFDFGANRYNGTVQAVHAGRVHQIGQYTYWWYIWVQSPDGYNEVYQEGFNRGDILVNEGQQVNVGTPLARVTQDHTHLGITNKAIPLAYYHGFNDDGTWLNPIDTIKKGMANQLVEQQQAQQAKQQATAEKADDTSDDDPDANVQYYFEPFIVSDQHSIDEWGLHPGPDVQDERFKDPNAMKAYAEKQLVPEPTITIELTLDTNEMPIAGEKRFLTIPHDQTILGEVDDTTTQDAYNTTVTVVGYSWYPFDPSQGTDITFNNVKASILHRRSQQIQVDKLADLALNKFTQIYFSNSDPSGSKTIKNGAMWIKPQIISEKNGGESNGGNKSDSGKSSTSGRTRQS